MKGIKVICFIFIALLVLSGCQTNQKTSDHKAYHRIISLMPSNTEILYELGLEKSIIGVSTVDDYPKGVKDKQQFDAFNLDYESLLKAKPDLIVAHESNKSTQEKVLNKLSKSGVKVVYVKDAHSIKEMYQSFEQIGKVTGKEQESKDLVNRVKGEITEVVKDIPKKQQGKKVFMEISAQPDIYTAGSDTFYDDMLREIKAKNIFHDEKGWIKTDKEIIVKRNPDVMIDTSGQTESTYQSLNKKRDGFDQIQAVKDNHIHAIDANKISRPGPRIAEGLNELADKVYD
ncbi:ABC transporter substrate-binding protein [Mammaliicoccus sp. Dog046]|uniref:ABC transporter substrate-binding protein n=1 Tax=Mammaliicoccus sp. Dog046 TaxID=3034233 RepID=UPI002B258EE5|nr:ABC transporter substrate-binding protein [Mammaliicoccus sp. Dog046]WQK85245.1 ABC transporter substrate-binding protein [Mammaliicoccus sp. Dog046]